MNEDPAAYFMMLGAEQEQERIIKAIVDYSNGEALISTDVAIALIKGEQE